LELVTAFEAMGHSVLLTPEGGVLPKHNGAPSDTSRRLVVEMRARKADVVEYLQLRKFIQESSELLHSTGYAKFWSASLMDMIYIISDWDILTQLPDDIVAFTTKEIRNLALIANTPAELHELAREKRLIAAAHKARLLQVTKTVTPPVEEEKTTVEIAAAIFEGKIC